MVGTIVGATLGHLLIIWPWPLAAIWHLALALAAAAALLGAFSETRARPGVGLALFTLAAVVLCQYEQACLRQAVAATAAAGGGPGSLTAPGTAESATEHALAGRCQPVNTVAYYLTRMISVGDGWVTPAVCDLIGWLWQLLQRTDRLWNCCTGSWLAYDAQSCRFTLPGRITNSAYVLHKHTHASPPSSVLHRWCWGVCGRPS